MKEVKIVEFQKKMFKKKNENKIKMDRIKNPK